MIRGRLIYKCRHCGVLIYQTDEEEYLIAPTRITYDKDTLIYTVRNQISHECFSSSQVKLISKYIGICDLVGIQEVPLPEEKK